MPFSSCKILARLNHGVGNEMSDAQEEIDNAGGGSGSYAVAGYDYQIDVSVWLALDLALASKLTQELVLEPGSEEDIEASLQEFEPSHVTSNAQLDSYRLVVQVKLRTGDAWTVNGIKTLLNHGSDTRASAATRLADPQIRYLLVTNAALNGGTRNLSVRRASVWPSATAMPSSIKKSLPTGAAGRVAVVGNLDQEKLAGEIKRLLTESFRVPNARWKECFKKLHEEARVRVCGAGLGRWKRHDLEKVIRDFEGYIASSPELEHYVHPTNWNELRKAMTERHAALIIGQSGTGKTLATKKLYEELRQEIHGLSRVLITHGPQQLRDDTTNAPVLYDIEDPWGRFDFEPNSRPWNDQLSQLLSSARPDRMIVVTSRLDVAQSAKILKDIEPWLVRLEAEHYGKSERQRLYRTRIPALPRELQLVTKQNERQVLDELATPLEIQKFFDALLTLDRKGLANPGRLIRDAIQQAHETSIERTVIEQIKVRADERASAVIWGLLKANDKLSLQLLRVIEEELAERDPLLINGVEPLVSFFVAARNLRQTETVVTYYHPRVEAGIQRALEENGLLVRKTLRHLIDILVSPDGPGESWGTATAVKIVASSKLHPEFKLTPSTEAQTKVDTWLAKALQTTGKDFESNLKLAAAAGSSGSTVSEVARYLLNRPDRSWPNMMAWGAPEHDDCWYAQIRADSATKPLIETFIRDILPNARDEYGKSFSKEVGRLASNLSDAFLAAAARSVHYGVFQTSETIAEGALSDLDGFEAIVDSAIKVLTPTEAERQKSHELHLAIVNGEYDEEYAEYLANDDDGFTASEFIGAYVSRVRDTRGWQQIAQHRHLNSLRYYWLKALQQLNAKSLADEVAGVFAASFDTEDERYLWFVLEKFWDDCFSDPLRKRVIEGHASEDVRSAALICMIERLPDQIGVIIGNLLAGDQHARLTQLAMELGHLRIKHAWLDGKNHIASAEGAVSNLPALYQEISEAALALKIDKTPSLSSEALEFLSGMSAVDADLRGFRVALNSYFDFDVKDDVRWLLTHCDDNDIAIGAIKAAIRHKMHSEVEAALTHRFAHVVSHALIAIAEHMPAPLPMHLLSLAEAKGNPVRQALVGLLDKKPHSIHLPTLLALAKDTWTNHSNYNYEEADFPIAQAAVAAIGKLGSIDDSTAKDLWEIALESRDSTVRYEILKLVAVAAPPSSQQRLLELAITPGRGVIRRAASRALLSAGETLGPELIAGITPDLINSRVATVASSLTLLLAWRGDVCVIEDAGKMLAANAERRVFVLLLIWLVKNRDIALTERLTAMLPAGHPAVKLALGDEAGSSSSSILDDLGEPEAVAEVQSYLFPQKQR